MDTTDFDIDGRWLASPRHFLIERHIADTMTSAHWHDHVEINLLLDGSMTYLFNGMQERVEAGCLAMFWAAIPHQTVWVSADVPLICIYVPLGDFLALPIDGAARQAVMQGSFISEALRHPTTNQLVSRWLEEWENGNAARRGLVIDEVKLRVRRLLLDHAENGDGRRNATALIDPTIRHAQLLTELINNRYTQALSLASLAKLAGIHPTTANRAFRQVLGISVMEYLTRYRLARAMQRLAETDDAILELAHDCGFGSAARFYEIFRKRTGTTPRQFRLTTRVG